MRRGMTDTPFITETKPLLTAMIHLQIPRSEIQHVMGPGITEGMAASGPYKGLGAAWTELSQPLID